MTARFQNPVDTRFGWGSLQDLAAITEQQTVALVTFPEARGWDWWTVCNACSANV